MNDKKKQLWDTSLSNISEERISGMAEVLYKKSLSDIDSDEFIVVENNNVKKRAFPVFTLAAAIAAVIGIAAITSVIVSTGGILSASSGSANDSSTVSQVEGNIAPSKDFKYKYADNGDSLIITEYTGNAKELVIPSEIGGKNIIRIGESAFSRCESLTSVIIPDGIKYIDAYAFSECYSLRSVTIPASVTSIGQHAFFVCQSLTSVTIREGVTSISDYAFSTCTSLASITIPSSVVSLGKDIFYRCDSLVDINVAPNNETYRSEDGVVFSKDKTEIIYYPPGRADNSYTIPSDVVNIKGNNFYQCANLANINVDPDNEVYRSIDGVVFSKDMTKLVCYPAGRANKSYYIPSCVTAISENAFQRCLFLQTITIADSVTEIGDYAFVDCERLTSVTIPESVTSIGQSAFYLCKSLLSVTIPDSVTSIGEGVFDRCLSLTSVTIPSSITEISAYAFSGCESLKSVTVHNGVTSIGDSAFCLCESLTSVTIPDSVTSIGDSAFAYCYKLTSVHIPNLSADINRRAFDDGVTITRGPIEKDTNADVLWIVVITTAVAIAIAVTVAIILIRRKRKMRAQRAQPQTEEAVKKEE
ncbi:MAG: leucine-rich repeat domain-containing protein [Ruminiclostridium sp.]|nr:leucine-rich repeat domain-containing protein [Ruminiclostridium sp.]